MLLQPMALRLPLAFLAAAALPSAAAARDDSQLWIGGSAVADLGKGFRLSEEVITRFSDHRGGLYEIESNTLLGFRLAPRTTFWAGYTHNPTYSHGRFAAMEHRAREQLTVDGLPAGPGTVSLRLRMEERWRDGFAGTGWRLRPFVKYSLPLHRGGHTAIVFSHESFLNLNRTAFQARTGEERMRNAVAITTPLAKGVNAEIGYLNQHGFVRGGPDTSDHVATLTLSLAL
ncbi:MAG: hypothetical protein QOE79_431 [Sphingomonadales bacterium]|jgi:hypothetical protein|nr:hypothetical protein [Sphingomonadales bacterium]